jgi:transcriptional regulator with XRE-family HTH domain
MPEFVQNEQSKRFLQALDNLISKQIVNNDAEFCRIVGYAPQSFSQIRKGKRNITIELIDSAHKHYAIDVNFIFSGEVDPEVDPKVDPVQPKVRLEPKSMVNEGEVSYKTRAELEAEIASLKSANSALIEAFKAIGEGKSGGAGDVGRKGQKSA